jgi:excisionase family DNA binding protein
MLLTIEDAATYLGLSTDSVRYLARLKRIPGAKVGRTWRFLKDDLDTFIRSQYGSVKDTEPEIVEA